MHAETRSLVMKVKGQLELHLMREINGNKKGLYKCTNDRRKTRENVGLLLNGAGALVSQDMEKAEMLNAFFTLVFAVKISLQHSQALATREKG